MAQDIGVSLMSFNPCFIGLASATWDKRRRSEMQIRFNPCFIGLASATIGTGSSMSYNTYVSILVLLD